MDSFFLRVLSSIAIDVGLAWLCGLLLAASWLRAARAHDSPLPSLTPAALTLTTGLFLQLLALTASFTGASSLRVLLAAIPQILSTHPGGVLGLSLLASLLLLALLLLCQRPGHAFKSASTPPARYRLSPIAVVFIACIILRSGAGHAATEALFTPSQLAQFVHLAAMSVWSGGVLVSGFVVLPRLLKLDAAQVFLTYLAALSRCSTWAVAAILISGVFKGYTGLDGNLHSLVQTSWGLTLAAKLLCVLIALSLGATNRVWLTRGTREAPSLRSRAARVLQAEAVAMAAILLLSATLANLAPPGE